MAKTSPRRRCPNTLHDWPLPLEAPWVTGYRRLRAGWACLRCPDCGVYGWRDGNPLCDGTDVYVAAPSSASSGTLSPHPSDPRSPAWPSPAASPASTPSALPRLRRRHRRLRLLRREDRRGIPRGRQARGGRGPVGDRGQDPRALLLGCRQVRRRPYRGSRERPASRRRRQVLGRLEQRELGRRHPDHLSRVPPDGRAGVTF